MYPINLLNYVSVIKNADINVSKKYYEQITKGNFNLKNEEVDALIELVNLLGTRDFDIHNNFYINYTIPHIGKEFDLLRISEKNIINIELKSIYNEDNIEKQIKNNKFYLNALGKEIKFYIFILSNKEIYQFDKKLIKIDDIEIVRKDLQQQDKIYYGNINDLFKPHKFLISPFTTSDEFIKNNYFLTNQQLQIKNEIIKICKSNTDYKLLLIKGGAGTGKTLLLYDIVKELKKTAIIHCGNLNNGHNYLNVKGWHIFSAKDYTNVKSDKYSVIAIDEGQRFDFLQLLDIIDYAKEKNITIIVACDPKQILNISEKNTDTMNKYVEEKLNSYELSSSIRSNKEIYSYIRNMFDLNDKAKQRMNYNPIKLYYFKRKNLAIKYIKYLKNKGWTFINYTTSLSKIDCFDLFNQIGSKNAHRVLGQEFDKVVFVLDGHFKYENGKLIAEKRDTTYDDLSMLYQIVTRAVNELAVVVYDNIQLFEKLVEIKN